MHSELSVEVVNDRSWKMYNKPDILVKPPKMNEKRHTSFKGLGHLLRAKHDKH